MVQFFRSNRFQHDFEVDGFVTMPILSLDEIAILTQHCSEVVDSCLGSTTYPGLYISVLDEADVYRRRETVAEINRLLGAALSKHLHRCRILLGAYLVKPGLSPHTAPHQDGTIVDNERMSEHCSMTIWIALRDIDADNGALGVVRSSHRFSSRLIGTPPPAVRALTHGHEAMLFRYLTFVPLKAGEAIAFDTRCIHGAMPNASPDPRMAVAVRIAPQDTELYQYFLKPRTTDRLLKLKVSEEYLVRYRMQDLYDLYRQGLIPELCEVDGELDDDFVPLTSAELESLCRRYGSTDNGISIAAAGRSSLRSPGSH